MDTQQLSIDPEEFDPASLEPAVQQLRAGEVIAIPTETVYGVAAAATDEGNARLRELKGRAPDKPFPVAIASRDQAAQVGDVSGRGIQKLMGRFWPGPLTLVVPALGRSGTVALRVPAHRVAVELLRQYGLPVSLTSANRSGKPAPRTAEEVHQQLAGDLPLIVDAGPVTVGEASAIVEIVGSRTVVHRDGLIDRVMIQRTAARHVVFVCTGNTCRSPMAEAVCRDRWAKKRGVTSDQLLEHGGLVSSAGVAAFPGVTATQEAVTAVARQNIDLKNHRSRSLDRPLVEAADHVYALTKSHLAAAQELAGDQRGKCELLDPAGNDIADPIGGDQSVYDRCLAQIERAVEQRMKGWN